MSTVDVLIAWIRKNGSDPMNFGYKSVPANEVPLPLRRAIREAEESGLLARENNVLQVVESKFQWHYKMQGYYGPCPVCGCDAKRLKAKHRALPADEAHRRQGHWEKIIKVAR